MEIPINHPIAYARSLRRIAGQASGAPEQAAIPRPDAAAYAYGAAQAGRALAGKALADQAQINAEKLALAGGEVGLAQGGLDLDRERLAQGNRKLAEEERQFQTGLNFSKQQLQRFSDQNMLATYVALANLGVQGLGAWNQVQQQKRAGETATQTQSALKQIADIYVTGRKKIAEDWDEMDIIDRYRAYGY